jgi:hypothetical protein
MRFLYIGVGVLDGQAVPHREETVMVTDDELETLDDVIDEELEWRELLLAAKRG